ncbi:phosphoenolpyruvate--protein phosphotransferase, partial [bacterium]
LDMENVFREQLRAILRASAHGPVKILFPMVSDPAELARASAIAADEAAKLGLERGKVPLGAMIEIPSALFLFDEMAAGADFFSIGTNDLTQYLLAVDRGNRKVAHLYDPMHPAVLKALSELAESALRRKKHVSVCGELAAQPYGAAALIALGYTRFSITPSALLKIRRFIQCVDAGKLKRIKKALLSAKSSSETRKIIADALKRQRIAENLAPLSH